jgi:anion-transporting  ArsA/GET3 family ATPase
VSDLLDKRLLMVTGKGGVGKTTVAAALGLLAAGRGKRTVVCEVAEQERLAGMFGADGLGHRERELAPGLFGFSVDPESAKQEWLRYQLRPSALAGVLGHSRVFQYLTAAAPGLTELVTVGKVWELAQLERIAPDAAPYDLVVVDAPATGHGLAMMRAPRTFAEAARVGPIHRQAGRIHSFLADPAATGVVAVAVPEEIPVAETLDLSSRLRAEMGLGLDLVAVNGVLPERFSAEEARRLQSADGHLSRAAAAAVRAALTEHRRARGQRAQLRRLRRALDAPIKTLPFLFEPRIGPDQLERLARRLA